MSATELKDIPLRVPVRLRVRYWIRGRVQRFVRAAIRQSVRWNSPRACFWLMDFQKKMGWRYEQ